MLKPSLSALSHKPTFLSDYDGGGTYFSDVALHLTLEQGHLVIFDAKLDHQGLPITRGVRYLLVAFCYTKDEREARVEGNVSLECDMIMDETPAVPLVP